MAWTAPRTWVAGEVVTAAIMNTHVRDNLVEVLQRDGSVALTGNWDAGSYEIRAQTLESDVTTGTAPFTIASTTASTNLNADLVDGQHAVLDIASDHSHQSTGAEGGKIDHGLALDGLTDDDHTQYQKESLLTTAGDMPYATANATWARLGIGTALQYLRTNAGATAPEWATESFGRDIFIPVTYGTQMVYSGTYPIALCDAQTETAFLLFHVPLDFNAIVTAEIIVIPQATQASANWDIYSNYAALTESYQTHAESDTSSTYNVTANVMFNVSIAGILTSLAANDFVGIQFIQSTAGHNVAILGIHFRYS